MNNSTLIASTTDSTVRLSRGSGVVLAVVDEQVDLSDHPDFDGRLLPGYAPERSNCEVASVRRPHGTKVAGLAAAGGHQLIGIAPDADILPVSVPALCSLECDSSIADALIWTADHGADVICCAWAPRDPSEESGRLPPRVRSALDYCLTHGRAGKGCVIVFSAGNDGSDLALNGYASHPAVIAVGACNCHGKHPSYSGWGDALWCVFPSNDPHDPVGASMTYLTTAPVGSLLDGEAFYTTRFGFTSAACAAVAGICALIVSANPNLTSGDVKAVLRDCCEKIDVEGGSYDEHGHSPLYGYGRPDVARAVELAQQRGLLAEAHD
jgi:subtilisin family serine protease